MDRDAAPRILVIDDDAAVGPLYHAMLQERRGYHVDHARLAGEGLGLARATLYDLVICDAKLPFKGASFGGLLLAEELSRLCGRFGVLVVSQVVDDEVVRRYDEKLFFLKKPSPENVFEWFDTILPARISQLLARQYAFVAMPFDKKFDAIFSEGVSSACQRAGYTALRVDRVGFGDSIVERTFQLVRDAHLVVLVATDSNPNAFFEAGLAFALSKTLIIVSPSPESLPFNIRNHRCVFYGSDPQALTGPLLDLLLSIRGA